MSSSRAATTLVACFLALAVLTALSLALGAQALSPGQLLGALIHPGGGGEAQRIVIGLRLPRTAVALVAGAALGLAGAVMQGVTRNPLADPGLLGVNAGASLAVVVAIAAFGIGSTSGYVWFAFGGATAAAAIVYAVGVLGPGGATPVKLALAGAALTATLTSVVTLVLLAHQDVFQQFRFWQVGSVSGRSLHDVAVVAPLAAAGAVLALVGGRMLDVLALGDDAARGLGLNVPLARAICAVAVVLLAGSATSVAGPIVFVGLVATHAARLFAAADHRWLIGLAGLIGAALLVASDLIGRFIAPPGELEAGVVIALIGAPVMIALIRRRGAVVTA
jgi:iron complex transport system permease protein